MRLTIATSILGEASKKLKYLRNQKDVMRFEGDRVSWEMVKEIWEMWENWDMWDMEVMGGVGGLGMWEVWKLGPV